MRPTYRRRRQECQHTEQEPAGLSSGSWTTDSNCKIAGTASATWARSTGWMCPTTHRRVSATLPAMLFIIWQAFPDCMVSFILSSRKTGKRKQCRAQEEDAFDEGHKRVFENDPSRTTSDYQVSSAERFIRSTNEMLMNAGTNSDWPAPLMVRMKSKSETKNVNNQRMKDWKDFPLGAKTTARIGTKDIPWRAMTSFLRL